MEPLFFDFAEPIADVRSVSPVEAPPSQGNTPRTKHCSVMGAAHVLTHVGKQQEVLLAAYRTHGALSDSDMERITDIDRSTVIPRRHELMKRGLVMEIGTRKNARTGISNTTFGVKGSA